MNKPVFLTFGENGYDIVKFRLINQAIKTGWFSKFIALDKTFLMQDPVILKHLEENVFNNTGIHGYGYYFWKPYVIYKTLLTMPENEILFYLDAGSTINPYGEEKFNSFVKPLIDGEKNITCFTFGAIIEFVKKDVLKYFNVDEDIEFCNKTITIGGINFWKNTLLTRKIVQQWLEACMNVSLIDNSTVLTNHKRFVNHSHDQAILSILLHKNFDQVNFEIDNSFSENYNDEEYVRRINFPFLATRYRDGDIEYFIKWVNNHPKFQTNIFV